MTTTASNQKPRGIRDIPESISIHCGVRGDFSWGPTICDPTAGQSSCRIRTVYARRSDQKAARVENHTSDLRGIDTLRGRPPAGSEQTQLRAPQSRESDVVEWLWYREDRDSSAKPSLACLRGGEGHVPTRCRPQCRGIHRSQHTVRAMPFSPQLSGSGTARSNFDKGQSSPCPPWG